MIENNLEDTKLNWVNKVCLLDFFHLSVKNYL